MASEGTVNDSSARIVSSSSTFPKMALLLMCLQLLLLSTVVRGEIQCECDTPDCKHNSVKICQAKYYCFIEYKFDRQIQRYEPTVRGCIDSPTPINCERFVPQDPNGRSNRFVDWPVNYCCDDSWCNTEQQVRWAPDKPNAVKKVDKHRKITNKNSAVGAEPHKNQSKKSKYGHAPALSPNPAHIAVPVAGAFFVISLIVLVIILVRRKETEDNNNSLANKYQTVSVSFGSAMKPTIAKDNSYEAPPIPPPIPLYASVGSKPAYPLCPVVTRAPC